MNDDRTLERRIAASYEASVPSREPVGLLDDILLTTSRARQGPRWLAITKEPPMRISSGVAVGSPTARITALASATLLLVILASGAVLAGAAYLAGPAALVVAQDGSGTHETIIDAVAAAEDGDTILVKPGTYIGTVVIDKDITLKGDGPREQVVIEFASDSPTIQTEWATLPYGVLLVDTSATVADLAVHGPNVAAAFVVVGGGPTIERVTSTLQGLVGDQPHSGVGLVHGASATIRESIMDGPIWNLGGATLPEYGGVQGANGFTVTDSVIEYGISGIMTDGDVVTGNTMTGGGGISVSLDGGGSAEVSRNSASYIHLDAADSTGITLRENALRGGDGDGVGITLGPGSPVVEGNQITGVATGIAVPDGAKPTIHSNAIEDTTFGILVRGQAAPVIDGNRFCGNEQNLMGIEGSTLTLDPGNEVCPTG